jgi:signal transduction histidine kinase
MTGPAGPAPEERLDETAALLVHELRTPLTVISGYLELLHRPLDDDERRRVLEAATRAVRRLDELLDEYAAGRGPTCPAPLDLKRLDLGDVIERVAADTEAATGRGIETRVVGTPCVLADEGRVERVLTNLLRNAVKYSPPDTPISLTASRDRDDALIVVEDEGPGIPARDRARVLKRFERLERDAEKDGSGLGLAIVREIVEVHGGAVEIGEGTKGGASVRVRLPLCSPQRSTSA